MGYFLFVSEGNNEESKMQFSEDEKTLIARMYKLIGKRFFFPFDVFLFIVGT